MGRFSKRTTSLRRVLGVAMACLSIHAAVDDACDYIEDAGVGSGSAVSATQVPA